MWIGANLNPFFYLPISQLTAIKKSKIGKNICNVLGLLYTTADRFFAICCFLIIYFEKENILKVNSVFQNNIQQNNQRLYRALSFHPNIQHPFFDQNFLIVFEIHLFVITRGNASPFFKKPTEIRPIFVA